MSDDHTLIDHAMQVFKRQRPVLPVGMQDEPTRCYKINLEWCKYVAAAMSELINLQAWSDAEDERHAAIQQLLVLLEGDDCVDCNDVEDCLETSPTITNINTTITTVQQAQEECCEQITQVINIYPPEPTQSEAIDLCSAAVYLAQQLSGFWHDVVADAQVITFDEFVEALLALGGFDLQFVRLLWDFVVSNANPNLVAEGEAAFDEIVKIAFCNEFDRDLMDLEIDGSATITADAKGLWRGALSSVTDGKIATWVFLGSLKGLSSEQCLCAEICGVHDFALSDGDLTWQQIPLFPGQTMWDAVDFWHSVPTDNIVGSDFDALYLHLTFTDRPLSRVDIYFDFDHYEFTHTGSVQSWQLLRNGTVIVADTRDQTTMIEGDNQLISLDAAGQGDIDEIRILMTAWIGPGIPTPPQGYARVRKVVIVCGA